jgi:hexosaminidase
MPGHARAILAAHPELSCTGKKQEVPRTWGVFDDVLCAGNEATYALLGHVLEELTTVFPSQLVHVGGDEVPTTRWASCPKCRAKAKASNVDVKELEPVFMHRIAATLARLGRRMVVWDEAVSSERASRFRLPADTVVLAWQSIERGRDAARLGYDVVMAPHDKVYFNIHQSSVKGEPGHEGFLPWPVVRAFEPIPPGLDEAAKRHVLGGEGALWTEHVETAEQIDAMVMPRMAALAEALWSGARASEADFVLRWNAQTPVLDAGKVEYFVEPPSGLRAKHVFIESSAVAVEPPRLFPSAVVRWTIDGSEPTASSPPFDAPVTMRDTTDIAAALFLPGGRRSPVLRSRLVKERPHPPRSIPAVTKGAFYSYAEGDFHRLPDFAKLIPKARGRIAGIDLADLERALGRRMRKERFALSFEALVRVPVDGVYRFIARADDGVRVEVDRETVVEDDGEHAPRDADGEVALGAGLHDLRVLYFQGSEGKELELKLEGPGAPLGPLDVVVDATATER